MGKSAWYLQQIDLFKNISEKEIIKIADQVTEKSCKKKEILYLPEENNTSIYIIKKGEVQLYYLHNGKKLIIDILKEGSVFGNIYFKKTTSGHFAEAKEEAKICIFKKEDFLKIIKAKPEIMIELLTIVSERLNSYEKQLKNGLFDAKEKIIHFLETRSQKKILGLFKQKITHEQIAEQLGLSRETVTRAITALKKEKIIS